MNAYNDVVTEILLHVPLQSVLRFRAVCKSWCDIIDSSSFREFYSQKQSKNKEEEAQFLVLQYTRNGKCELSTLKAESGIKPCKGFRAFQEFTGVNFRCNRFSALKAESGIKPCKGFRAFQEFTDVNFRCNRFSVVGPVNGLILIYYKIPYGEGEHRYGRSFAIYNPCIDKIKILLYPRWNRSDIHREIGFGFDNVAKEFKVVQLIYSCGGSTHVEVYSGTTNSWRKLITNNTLDDNLILDNIKGIKSSAYMKNVSLAHWRTERWTELGYTEDVILSFNMHNEVFETIPFPNFDYRKVDRKSSKVFAKDDDSFTIFIHTLDKQKVEVWDLKSTNDERYWTHITNVDVFSKYIRPGALWERVGVVLMKYRKGRRNLLFYDYSKKKVRKSYKAHGAYTEILEYKGSLILP